jgi:hypothetical protein
MRIISFIEDEETIKKILMRLDLWMPGNHDPPNLYNERQYIPASKPSGPSDDTTRDDYVLQMPYEDEYSQLTPYEDCIKIGPHWTVYGYEDCSRVVTCNPVMACLLCAHLGMRVCLPVLFGETVRLYISGKITISGK